MSMSERPEVRGYDNVRAAARDYETYSSDLLGDRDVRDYRAIPLEADPPRHTIFRDAVQPIFHSSHLEMKSAQFETLACKLVGDITARGGGDLVSDLGLPYVMGCLAIIYNRPQDLDEWLSWGPDVWTAEAYSKGLSIVESRRAARNRQYGATSLRSGAMLRDYLERVFADVTPAIGADPATTDVWDWIAGIRIDGEPPTREETFGIAMLLLAGGRDTVIKLIVGLAWHLIGVPADREHLRLHPESYNRAIAELARYLSPIKQMERLSPDPEKRALDQNDPQRYVLINWLSANHDRSIWPDADTIDIHRERKPHVAFGIGRHSCMGMNITEYEAKAMISALVTAWPNWEFDGEPIIDWEQNGEGPDATTALESFLSVPVRVSRS